MRLKCSDALKPIYSDLSFKKLFYEQTIKNFECQIVDQNVRTRLIHFDLQFTKRKKLFFVESHNRD